MGAAFILGPALFYQALRGVEGMGMGDVKLMALIGAFLGVKLTLVVLLAGLLLGTGFGVFLMSAVRLKRLAPKRTKVPGGTLAPPPQPSRSPPFLPYPHFQLPFFF